MFKKNGVALVLISLWLGLSSTLQSPPRLLIDKCWMLTSIGTVVKHEFRHQAGWLYIRRNENGAIRSITGYTPTNRTWRVVGGLAIYPPACIQNDLLQKLEELCPVEMDFRFKAMLQILNDSAEARIRATNPVALKARLINDYAISQKFVEECPVDCKATLQKLLGLYFPEEKENLIFNHNY